MIANTEAALLLIYASLTIYYVQRPRIYVLEISLFMWFPLHGIV